jgi:hypothetical protein
MTGLTMLPRPNMIILQYDSSSFTAIQHSRKIYSSIYINFILFGHLTGRQNVLGRVAAGILWVRQGVEKKQKQQRKEQTKCMLIKSFRETRCHCGGKAWHLGEDRNTPWHKVMSQVPDTIHRCAMYLLEIVESKCRLSAGLQEFFCTA